MKVVAPAKRLHEAFYAMGILAHIPGGPHHVYFPMGETAARDNFKDIQAISSRMDWIRSVNRGLPPLLQYGLDLRPYQRKQTGRSMLSQMRYYCGFYDDKPWFNRMASTGEHIVVSRTLTQQNPLFPWRAILAVAHRHSIYFVGTDEEYDAFKPLIHEGVSITHMLPDWGGAALDACLSATLYIGNHSPALAVVEGAHVPSLVEVGLSNPDNIYLRDGSSPCFSNKAVFPEGAGRLSGGEVFSPVDDLLMATYADWPHPPKGWMVDRPGRAPRYFKDLDEACFYRCKYSPELDMLSKGHARLLILADTLRHYPEWADEAIAHRLFKKPTLALRAASRKIKLRRFLPPISNYSADLCD
jgi:hypothetical protein